MPQKKNPDAAELLRAKAPRLAGAPGRAPRRPARPAADLQQGPAGGQGAPVRRGRHARAVPRGRRGGMLAGIRFRRERLAAAAADEFLAATDVADLLVRRGRAVPRGPRRGRRARAPRARVAGARCPSSPPDELAAHSELLDDEFYARARRRRAGWSPRSRRAARRSARVREQLEPARAGRRVGRALNAAFYERPVARGRARADRLRRRPRRHRRRDRRDRGLPRVRAGLPRLRRAHARARRRCSGRPAARTSTAPTASTRCSTRSASRRASAAAVLIRALEPLEGIDADARAPRPRARRGPVLGPGQAHAGAGHRARPERRRACSAPARSRSSPRAGRPRRADGADRPADRDHEGGRAAAGGSREADSRVRQPAALAPRGRRRRWRRISRAGAAAPAAATAAAGAVTAAATAGARAGVATAAATAVPAPALPPPPVPPPPPPRRRAGRRHRRCRVAAAAGVRSRRHRRRRCRPSRSWRRAGVAGAACRRRVRRAGVGRVARPRPAAVVGRRLAVGLGRGRRWDGARRDLAPSHEVVPDVGRVRAARRPASRRTRSSSA